MLHNQVMANDPKRAQEKFYHLQRHKVAEQGKVGVG